MGNLGEGEGGGWAQIACIFLFILRYIFRYGGMIKLGISTSNKI